MDQFNRKKLQLFELVADCPVLVYNVLLNQADSIYIYFDVTNISSSFF